MIEWVLLFVVVLLVAANALFVAAEFSLVTVDRATIELQAEEGDRRAQGVQAGLRSLSTQLSGAQLGITVTSLIVGSIAELSLASLLRGPLEALGLGAAAGPVSFAAAFVAATVFQMVAGELVPKNLAIARPLGVAKAVVGAQRGFTAASAPLIRFLNGTANSLLRRVGVEPQEELASARSPQELASLVARSGEQGTLDARTAQLMIRSIEFGDRTAAEVMTPRRRVRSVRPDTPVVEVVALARRTGHSRFPVFGEGVDDPVGTVHLKHAVAVAIDERGRRTVAEVMSPSTLVPESMELDDLLALLRREGLQLAIVADEYGGTAGVVTLEDLIEEIVGGITDEHDRAGTHARRRSDGSWWLSGLLRPDEVAELTGIQLRKDDEYDTLAGLVSHELKRIPGEGDRVEIPVGDRTVVLTVQRMDGLRVDRVDFHVYEAAPPRDDEAGGQV